MTYAHNHTIPTKYDNTNILTKVFITINLYGKYTNNNLINKILWQKVKKKFEVL